nr:uncharacterized protein LOC127294463 isoform X2 [Lolium perenne]
MSGRVGRRVDYVGFLVGLGGVLSYSFSGVSASDAGEGFGPLSRRCPWWTLVQSRSGQSSSNKVVLHPDRPRIFLLSVSSSCWRGGRRRGRKERRIFCLIRLFRRLWMAGLDWLCGWPLEASSFSRGTARMRLRLLGGAPLRPCRWSFSDAFDSGVCAAWLLRQSTQLGASFFFHGDDSHFTHIRSRIGCGKVADRSPASARVLACIE